MSGGQFDWGGRLLKSNGGAQRVPQNGWKSFVRNPQSSGDRVSHPVYRYLYLHLLFYVKVADSFKPEDKEDFEMLSDMIVAACSDAYKQIDKTTKEKMAKYQAFLGGFGGMF